MSEQGLCSRREADDYIAKGWVKVDGETISELGTNDYSRMKEVLFVSNKAASPYC